jgi:predicted flavoprotein YhiN
MASKIVPGLFFAGEVIDIVGRRGGYNLHFAWASGHLAGRNISKI